MKFALSTIAGVESIAKKEIEKVGGKIEQTIDKLITFSGEADLIIKVNLWSRVGNKLYILLEEKENISNFDLFFDAIKNINFKKYYKKNFPILVKASSTKSKIFSEKTMQSLAKKAIVTSLVGEGNLLNEDKNLPQIEILILLIDNKLKVLLNTSGEALHKRGYRKDSSEAPIKESLAAALVLLSGWIFRENFYDLFCGSGTIPIEALMIAKNIAPGLKRKFAFENWNIFEKEKVENERFLASKKQFDGDYKIFANDIDENVLEIAKQNAKRAGLENEIIFSNKDFSEFKDLKGTFVSNPPYGNRLKPKDLENIYKNIDKIFQKNKELNGGIISSFLKFDEILTKDIYKKRKLYNGGDLCYFWKKNI